MAQKTGTGSMVLTKRLEAPLTQTPTSMSSGSASQRVEAWHPIPSFLILQLSPFFTTHLFSEVSKLGTVTGYFGEVRNISHPQVNPPPELVHVISVARNPQSAAALHGIPAYGFSAAPTNKAIPRIKSPIRLILLWD